MQITYECLTTWRQRLGLFSSSIKETKPVIARRDEEGNIYQDEFVENQIENELEGKATEKLVAHHVQLYNSFINDGRKFILAHNHFVSVFHLRKLSWSAHTSFKEG